jgi:hypothetical protein
MQRFACGARPFSLAAVSSRLQCHGCRHFVWASLESDRCSAFPDGIPDAIWLGTHDHALPFPGDGGVRREAPPSGSPAAAEARHEAWAHRRIERFAHETDPLGAIVASIDSAPLDVALDPASVASAWQRTEDAPAMLLVMLRARRTRELASALALATMQLEAEACDYPHDKGWLGVSLTLASYPTEAALADARAAWSALSSPFGDGYITARVQQTLVRSIRRVVPEAPPASEWSSAEVAAPDSSASNARVKASALNDAVVALRPAPPARTLIADVALLEPWTAVNNAQGLEAELARELVPGHRLHGRPGLRAVARRADSDDVLFVSDTIVAVVHLTWAKEPDPTQPPVEIFSSLEDFVSRRMNPDHDAFAGEVPRAFAFELRSPLTLAAMRERLPDRARWEWTLRDSAWYGDYLWAKDGPTRVRIFAEEEPERFTLQADLVDSDEPGADWFAQTRALVTESFLHAIEATNVVGTTPKAE